MDVYRDPVDDTTYPLEIPRWRSDAGRPLWLAPGQGISPADIDPSHHSIWRYRGAVPALTGDPISLGEGRTPLVPHAWSGIGHPLLKLDFLNPTGSFKDRGTSVMLSYLRDRGVQQIVEDSSGNGGASIAAYGAAGGFDVHIVAPATTSPDKISQVRAYGATVELVDGPREASQDRAIQRATSAGFYASHNWQAMFLQGTKTLAYELWEDLGFQAPDNVVVPVGAGSSLLGCWLGFQELYAAGQITQLPRLFAAQPLHYSPVDAALSFPATTVPREVRPTVAEGTAIAQPLRLELMLQALRETHGGSVAVTEHEIIGALKTMCQAGYFVEPTSAVAAAGYVSLTQRNVIHPAQITVVLLTGSGLKTATRVAELIGN